MKKFFLLILFILLIVVLVYFLQNRIQVKSSSENPTVTSVAKEENETDPVPEKNISEEKPSENVSESFPEKKSDVAVSESEVYSPEIHYEIPYCAAFEKSDGKSSDHEIIKHKGYTLCYRESYEQPEWVSYEMDRNKLIKVCERQNNFRSDPSVETASSDPDDYRKSGYDRGHLAPAADMAYDEECMSESFFMSNMSPQAPDFNRHIWAELEKTVREMTEKLGILYVVTGPVLEKNDYPSIGENEVAVPEYYYKVLLSPQDLNKDGVVQEWLMLAFILPNEGSNRSVWDYVVTVDEVEKRTGIDFFHCLNENLQKDLESRIDLQYWKD